MERWHIRGVTLILFCAGIWLLAMASHLGSISVAVWRTACRGPSGSRPALLGKVSVIRPVCGMEPALDETLRSTFHLRGLSYETLFCVAHSADPALPLVEALVRENPDVPARLLIGDERVSSNPKLNNIVKGWAQARSEWIAMVDSNVLMHSDHLVHAFSRWSSDTGLVCSAPIGCRPDNFWAELECAFLNTYQARWQYCADSLGHGFAQGKVMLWRREFLDAAGGLPALGHELAEDAAATKLVRARGLSVRLTDAPCEQPLGERTLQQVWKRQLRWSRLRRQSFLPWFLPEILTGVLPAACTAGAFASLVGVSAAGLVLASVFVWYAGEAAMARIAGWHLSWRLIPALLLRDLFIPVLWIASWTSNRFEWREASPPRGRERESAPVRASAQ